MAEVTMMGVKGGPAIKPGSNMPTSLLLRMSGKTILIDAGLGAASAICRAGVALTDIDAIYITHMHSDHYLELGPFFHTAWTAGLNRPIPVIGPSGLPAYWDHFLKSMAFDIALRIADEGRPALADLFEFTSISEGMLVAPDGIGVTALLNDHPPIKESFALRFEGEDKSFVFSGDTARIAQMPLFAKDADLLVHEAMMVDGVNRLVAKLPNIGNLLRTHILRSHTPAHEVGEIAAEAGVQHLALTHLVPDGDPLIGDADWITEVRRAFHGPLTIGKDGIIINL
ncbi:MAG: MBL fold metallo-hydrolase [Pseudomonadota bacterium]